MKLNRNSLAVILSTSLSLILFAIPVFAQTPDSQTTLQRGYRTGYSDGFMAGYKDTIDSLAKDYSRHADYVKADRAYNKDYGTIDDYRDGYQQGFESGYDLGFDKRSYEATVPTDLKRRGVTAQEQSSASAGDTSSSATSTGTTVTTDTTATTPATPSVTEVQAAGNAIIIIPRDTELILELQEDLDTQKTAEGTKFTAKIIAPSEISGATIEGRVSKITKPGRLKGRSEISLSFDRIILSDNRWSNFSGTLTEVIAVKGDNVKRVDSEGTAIGQNSYKENAIKIGAPAGAGLVIGAIAGGPAGAAVGAGVGAAFGVGAVVVKRGKHIKLTRNQQLRVKSAYETQIR